MSVVVYSGWLDMRMVFGLNVNIIFGIIVVAVLAILAVLVCNSWVLLGLNISIHPCKVRGLSSFMYK
jgi:hypothetical protein